MRVWSFDDSKEASASLVLEQDFILRIRRLRRMGASYLVANVRLSALFEEAPQGALEAAQERVQTCIDAQKGTCAAMTNGDLFILWPLSEKARAFPQDVLRAAFPKEKLPEDVETYLTVYTLPQDYAAVRERADVYVDLSKTAAAQPAEASAVHLLKGDGARGPLTAWSLNQIERLAEEVDLRDFIRAQPVYGRREDGVLCPAFDEIYLGLQDIKQTYFPHLDVASSKHLFLDMCRIFDQALLTTTAQNYASLAGREISFNLSLSTVLGASFAQFTHSVLRTERRKIRFEIHCGDLLQDFAQTLSIFSTLRQEGYQIAIDGVAPDMLPYFNFERFDPDYVKVDVSKETIGRLGDTDFPAILSKKLRQKIVFAHCDSERALAIGIACGITQFQGWHIDALVLGSAQS